MPVDVRQSLCPWMLRGHKTLAPAVRLGLPGALSLPCGDGHAQDPPCRGSCPVSCPWTVLDCSSRRPGGGQSLRLVAGSSSRFLLTYVCFPNKADGGEIGRALSFSILAVVFTKSVRIEVPGHLPLHRSVTVLPAREFCKFVSIPVSLEPLPGRRPAPHLPSFPCLFQKPLQRPAEQRLGAEVTVGSAGCGVLRAQLTLARPPTGALGLRKVLAGCSGTRGRMSCEIEGYFICSFSCQFSLWWWCFSLQMEASPSLLPAWAWWGGGLSAGPGSNQRLGPKKSCPRRPRGFLVSCACAGRGEGPRQH